MGLFGSTKIYVSSVSYNMAGDYLERINYLKSLITSNVINNSRFSMSESLSEGYLNGAGIRARQFHRWCKTTNYDQIGVITANVLDSSDVTPYLVSSYVPHSADSYVSVSNLRKGKADYSYWADQYMFANHPSAFTEAWTADYDQATNQITITRADGVTTYTFTPTGLNWDADYIYVTYNTYLSATGAWQSIGMWIYELGSGITAIDDAVAVTSGTEDEFLSFIPIRIENQFLSPTHMPTLYNQAVKAYRKVTGGMRFSEIVAKIGENESLADIDHAYIVNGVSLNTKERHGQRYIFQFFERMLASSNLSWSIYDTYITRYGSWSTEYNNWLNSRATWADEHPGEPYPPPPAKPTDLLRPAYSVTMRSNGLADVKLDMTVSWTAVRKLTGTGLGKVGAKVGETWWSTVTSSTGEAFSINLGTSWVDTNDNPDLKVKLYWQKTADSWEAMEIVGLKHENMIYGGQAVEITVQEALSDADESGFILPIHYDTLTGMSLIDSTQMMLSSSYIVFNCYKVVKQKWYQTGIFKIVVFVAIIAISVATGGFGAVGLLGTAGSVGAALGVTGFLGALLGAIVNALAAMIVMQLISKISVAVFGEKFGAIIGAIAAFAAMTIGVGFLNGGNISTIWTQLTSPMGLMQLTSAVGNGISGYVQGAAKEVYQDMAAFQKESDAKLLQVQELYAANIGYGKGFFDPMSLTGGSGNFIETSTQFLSRTLLTGTDIADMSMNMVTNFADMTIAVDLGLGA